MTLNYSVMGRPNIFYDSNCAQPISEAIQTLNDLIVAEENINFDDVNEALWPTVVSWACALFIYQIVNMICYSIRNCRVNCCCCHNSFCFKTNRIVFACVNFLIGAGVVTFTSLAFASTYEKYSQLANWGEFRDCVSAYEQISQDNVDTFNSMQTKLIANLVLACIILCIGIFNVISVLCFCCIDKHTD